MKWIVAGFAFAGLIALAIATAAIRSQNIRTRGRIEQLQRDVVARQFESLRQRSELGNDGGLWRLAARWREMLAAVERRQQ
jgi:hypothetical protein